MRAVAGGFQFDPVAVGPGQYIISYTVTTTGVCQSTRTVRYVVAPPVTPVMAPVAPQCTTLGSLTMTATPAGGTFAGPGVSGSRFDPAMAGAGTHTLTYTVSDSLGCGTTSQQVVVGRPPVIVAGPDTTFCADLGRAFQLRGTVPAGGTWSGPGVSASGVFTPPATNNRGGVFPLTYTVVDGACRATAVRTVVLAPVATQNVPLGLPVCGVNAQAQYAGFAPFDCPVTPLLLAPGATYRWDFGDGSPISTEAAPTHHYQQAGAYHIQLTARYGQLRGAHRLRAAAAHRCVRAQYHYAQPRLAQRHLPAPVLAASRLRWKFFRAGASACTRPITTTTTGMAGAWPTAFTTTCCAMPTTAA